MATKRVHIDWKGDEVLKRFATASGDALAECAGIIAKRAKANIREHRLDRPGGFFKEPGAIEKTVEHGKFRGKGNFVGGYMKTTSLWFLIEYGTSRSRPTPWVKPAVMDSKRDMLAVLDRKIDL